MYESLLLLILGSKTFHLGRRDIEWFDFCQCWWLCQPWLLDNLRIVDWLYPLQILCTCQRGLTRSDWILEWNGNFNWKYEEEDHIDHKLNAVAKLASLLHIWMLADLGKDRGLSTCIDLVIANLMSKQSRDLPRVWVWLSRESKKYGIKRKENEGELTE